MITFVPGKILKEVSLNPKEAFPKEAYFLITAEDVEENVTVITPGKIGNEFNKIYGFFNRFPGVIIFRCLYGQGIMVIQKNDEYGQAKEVRVATLRLGVEVEVPFGYGFTIYNTGKTFLLMADNAPKNDKDKDIEPIRKKRGLVYYVVDKKGDVVFEKNHNYSFYPQISIY